MSDCLPKQQRKRALVDDKLRTLDIAKQAPTEIALENRTSVAAADEILSAS